MKRKNKRGSVVWSVADTFAAIPIFLVLLLAFIWVKPNSGTEILSTELSHSSPALSFALLLSSNHDKATGSEHHPFVSVLADSKNDALPPGLRVAATIRTQDILQKTLPLLSPYDNIPRGSFLCGLPYRMIISDGNDKKTSDSNDDCTYLPTGKPCNTAEHLVFHSSSWNTFFVFADETSTFFVQLKKEGPYDKNTEELQCVLSASYDDFVQNQLLKNKVVAQQYSYAVEHKDDIVTYLEKEYIGSSGTSDAAQLYYFFKKNPDVLIDGILNVFVEPDDTSDNAND